MPRLPWGELDKPAPIDDGWVVREVQGSAPRPYTVRVKADRASCTCKAAEFGTLCKHIKGVRQELGLTTKPILEVSHDE